MIIQCDRCGTKFRLDDSRISGKGVRVRCTKCQNVFMAAPPPPVEEIQLEDIFGAAADETAADAAGPRRDKSGRKPVKDEKKENLAFDFREGSEGEAPSRHEPGQDPEIEGGLGSDAGSDGDDSGEAPGGQGFEFSPEGGAREEKNEWGLGDEKDDFSFGFEDPEKDHVEEKKKEIKEEVKEDEDEINFSFETPELVNREAAPSLQGALAAEAQQAAGAAREKAIPFAASGYAKEALVPEKAQQQKAAGDDFKEILSQNLSREDLPAFEDSGEEEVRERGGARARKPPASLGLMIAVLIVIVGGGLVYFTGAIDKLAEALTPGEAKVKTVGIETIEGYYAENSNVGRIFVIQARVRNLTEEPQEIKAATGAIYDRSGKKLGSRSVSPGRVVSLEEVGSLSREDLLKSFKDPSGGIIPPRGTVPVMVVFTEAEGVAEYGIDIVR
ncbi:MAG: zinc-ribbon domain-containing protein [Candidatus Methylomirabilis sp.]|nr:zinc-ribbon domain-containing protein [Deltaproteobacteria bacterium]